jgi:hypothetical protein
MTSEPVLREDLNDYQDDISSLEQQIGIIRRHFQRTYYSLKVKDVRSYFNERSC